MKKHTAEERRDALEMMRKMGGKQTSASLRISESTLHRWRREAELKALLEPQNSAVEKEEESLQLDGAVAEEEHICEEFEVEKTDCNLSMPALDEAVATIELLSQENARLLKIIKHLRSVIRGMAEMG